MSSPSIVTMFTGLLPGIRSCRHALAIARDVQRGTDGDPVAAAKTLAAFVVSIADALRPKDGAWDEASATAHANVFARQIIEASPLPLEPLLARTDLLAELRLLAIDLGLRAPMDAIIAQLGNPRLPVHGWIFDVLKGGAFCLCGQTVDASESTDHLPDDCRAMFEEDVDKRAIDAARRHPHQVTITADDLEDRDRLCVHPVPLDQARDQDQWIRVPRTLIRRACGSLARIVEFGEIIVRDARGLPDEVRQQASRELELATVHGEALLANGLIGLDEELFD